MVERSVRGPLSHRREARPFRLFIAVSPSTVDNVFHTHIERNGKAFEQRGVALPGAVFERGDVTLPNADSLPERFLRHAALGAPEGKRRWRGEQSLHFLGGKIRFAGGRDFRLCGIISGNIEPVFDLVKIGLGDQNHLFACRRDDQCVFQGIPQS